MNGDESVLHAGAPHGRPADSVTPQALGWLSLLAALPGLVSGVTLFLYYLSNFGIDSLFNALNARWLDYAWLAGLALSASACILGGALTHRARRRHSRATPARWAFWLGLAGLITPLGAVISLICWFTFWP